MEGRIVHYLLGNDTLDSQHKTILLNLNSLRRKISSGTILKKDIQSKIDSIKNMWALHTQQEESMMKLAKFGGLSYHVASHVSIAQSLDRLNTSSNQYTIGDAIEYIVNHIDGYDRAFVDHLKKN